MARAPLSLARYRFLLATGSCRWPRGMRAGAMGNTQAFMALQNPTQIGNLIGRTGLAIGAGPAELAKHFDASRRSVSRWIAEGTLLSREKLTMLTELAYERDPALAREIAAAVGETLVSLGVEAASSGPTQAALPVSRLVDVVVCAAAEAMDASPRAIRPALLAASARPAISGCRSRRWRRPSRRQRANLSFCCRG
jgi:hypothetical protein